MGKTLSVPKTKPVTPEVPYYASPRMPLQRQAPVLRHHEINELETEESFTSLMAKHVDSLTNKVSPGDHLDISDIFITVYNARLLEDPHLIYDIDFESTKDKSVSFDSQTRTLHINPTPFLKIYESYPNNKLVFLAYVGLTIHYYANLKLKHPCAYSLDMAMAFSETYNNLFETIATLVFKNENLLHF